MKRIFQLVVCLSLVSSVAMAGHGGIGERLFFQVGGTVGADVMQMTGKFLNLKNAGNLKDLDIENLNINLATVSFVGRINLLELSNNTSLSLAFRPAASIGRSINDFGGPSTMLRLPFTFDFNSGAAATVSTRSKTGFVFGVGTEFISYPALGDGVTVQKTDAGITQQGQNENFINMKGSWIQPVATFGIRFFGKNYSCREINFKACFKPEGDVENKSVIDNAANPYSTISNFQNMGLMLSYIQFLNY